MKDMKFSVSAKAGAPSHVFVLPLPTSLEEWDKRYGLDPAAVFARCHGSLVITVANSVRRRLESGETPARIQTWLSTWRPGDRKAAAEQPADVVSMAHLASRLQHWLGTGDTSRAKRVAKMIRDSLSYTREFEGPEALERVRGIAQVALDAYKASGANNKS